MPRGDKASYTDKQDRQADHIAQDYEHRGVPGKKGGAAAASRTGAERSASAKQGATTRKRHAEHHAGH